jgi:hypothetical protein
LFCDVDEYFFPLKVNSLRPFVDEAEDGGFNQIHAKWVFFGPDSLNDGAFKENRDVTGMNFRHAELNSEKPFTQGTIKSIVDARTISYMGEHYANNSDNNKRKFLPLDELRINHYNLRHFHTWINGGQTRPVFDDPIKRFYPWKSFWTRLSGVFK